MTRYNVEIVVNGRDNASGALGSVGSALSRMGEIAGGILAAGIFQRVASGIASMGREALDSYASWERMGMAMTSMTARELMHADSTLTMKDAMSQASGKAEEMMNWLQKLAIESPFDAEGVSEVYKQGLTYGFTSQKAQELTQVLLDMSAGMGLSGDQMGRVSYAVGQINASDQLLMQDLRQLMNAGVPVNDILGKMGYTIGDVGQKTIDSKKFIDTFLETMGSDFKGAAKNQAEGWSGLLNSISDIKKIGLREFFTGTFKAIQPYVAKFVNLFTQPEFLAKIQAAGNRLGAFAQKAIDVASKIKGISFSNLAGAGGVLSGLAPAGAAFEKIKGVIAGLWPTIQGAASAIGGSLTTNIKELAAKVIPWLVGKVQLLSTWFQQNKPLIQSFITTVGGFIANNLIPAVTSFWQVVEPILNGLINLALGVGKTIMQVVTGDWTGAWNTMTLVTLGLGQALLATIDGLLNWIAGLFGTSLAEIRLTWSSNWSALSLIVSTTWTRVKSAISTGILSIIASVKGTAAKLREAGSQIIAGLWTGITDRWANMVADFKNLIALLPQAVKDLLGIASPSVVFKAFGRNIVQGLALGMQSMANLPTIAFKSMMTPAFAYAGSAAAPRGGGQYSQTDNRQVYGVVNNYYTNGRNSKDQLRGMK